MRTNKKTIALCQIALLSALMSISAWIALPFPIPVTLQLFVLFLMAFLFSPSISISCCMVYLALGVVGLPVFSGFQSGIGTILGPSGGFLVAFLPSTALVSFLCKKHTKPLVRFLLGCLGLFIVYLVGSLWYTFVYGGTRAFYVCVLPFLLPDLCKLLAAALLSYRLRHFFGKGAGSPRRYPK